MFWEHGEVTLGGVEGLELRLVGSWNKQVSHYHVSETGTCIRNVKDGQTLYVRSHPVIPDGQISENTSGTTGFPEQQRGGEFV